MAEPIKRILFAAADKMRGAMDPGEYKHVALDLLFLRYVSAPFEAKRAEFAEDDLIDLEDPEEYQAESVFWVPEGARWDRLAANAKANDIGVQVDDAMRQDHRWRFGTLPAGNANFAWMAHVHHHLSANGVAGVVMANGSMSSMQSGEGEIRKAMVQQDAVDAIVALPGQLFFGTQIPACLWILAKDKSNGRAAGRTLRDRRQEVLFIDARKIGMLIQGSRKQKQLSPEEIGKIAGAYHAWRGELGDDAYVDEASFCKAAGIDGIERHNFVMTPGRYVSAGAVEDDGEPFVEKFDQLLGDLGEQFAEGRRLEAEIQTRLESLS